MQSRWRAITLAAAVIMTAGCARTPFANLAVTSGTVQVSGTAAVRAGDDAQYVATLDEQILKDQVTWLVNGVPGGNAALGTVSSSGHYTAPATLPSDPHIVISVLYAGRSGSAGVELWNPVAAIFGVTAQESGNVLRLEVTGKNFVAGAKLKIDGREFVASVISASQLTASVPSGAAQAGTIELAVANPAPGESTSDGMLLPLSRPVRTSRSNAKSTPTLPATSFDYVKYAVTDVPAQYTTAPGNPAAADNTPGDNPITNAGATLGRVLFYDRKLSRNDLTACASCHQQGRGFADPNRLSIGFQGGTTGRHSMGLSNARYYARQRFFWDERAATLEAQTLMPIQDSVEMGMSLNELITKLSATDYYPSLFQAAFGSPEITSDRISKALAQFVRSMVSYQSKYDSAFINGTPNFQAIFTASELRGLQLFGPGNNGPGRTVRCDRCHGTNAQIAPALQNTGLDAVSTDAGAGLGRFKVPSLRNVAVRSRFMHDGRFTSLEEVVQFYNAGVQDNPNLSQLLRNPDGTVTRLNLTAQEAADLVAFLQTLTDNNLLNDPRFSDPFQ